MTNLRRSCHIPITCTVIGDKFTIYGNQGQQTKMGKNTMYATDHTQSEDLSMVLSTEKDVYVYGSSEVFAIKTIHGPEPCQGQLLVIRTCFKVTEYAPRQQVDSRIVPRPCQHTRK